MIQTKAVARLQVVAATALSDADAKKIFKAFLAEDVSPKEVAKISFKVGPKKIILRGFGAEGVASDKELKRYNPKWTAAMLQEYLEAHGAKRVKASAVEAASRVTAASTHSNDPLPDQDEGQELMNHMKVTKIHAPEEPETVTASAKVQLGAASRLAAAAKVTAMDAWAEAMFKPLKRFDVDPGISGMGSSDGEWVDKDVGEQMMKALQGWRSRKNQQGTVSFYSATKPKCGVSFCWDEDEQMFQVFWFNEDLG